ncbi:DNA alkylation repair protein [Nocardioides sp. NBC_00368]|uniref:DNA alkylation repair protein n=1 Tax=Nocardioides sp. NBC_00368 TaxID=2976000 RepID=UPI002E1D3EFB
MSEPGDALIRDLHERMAEAADPGRAPQMQAYMKSDMPFHGIASPVMKRLTRECFQAHPLDETAWLAATERLWDEATHREERYAALALFRWRTHREAAAHPDRLALYHHLAITGAWWDLVDEIAQHLVGPVLLAHRDRVTPVIAEWAADSDIWVRRTAILSQARHKAETDPVLLDRVLNLNLEDSLHGKVFWIRKAVGWALREYAKTDPVWVRSWVDDHDDRLSGLARREALKHF